MKPGALLAAWLLFAGCRQPPASHSSQLEPVLGSWHGVRRDATDGTTAPIVVRVEALPGSAGEIERLEVATGAKPYVGFTVRMPDRPGGAWTMLYANSTRAKISRLAGRFEGTARIWESIAPDGSHRSKLRSEMPDPDHWRRVQSASEDGGKSWTAIFTDELERDR